MADRPRMTAAQLANKLLVDKHPDVLGESAAWMAAQLMEAEVAAQIGAELGERSPERRTHRNGYRSRTWDTRVGELELAIPRLRQGSYFPSFLEPRRRAEQALVAVVQEAYVNGVTNCNPSPRRSPASWRPPRRSCWPSTSYQQSTGPSCAAPTRWNGSTARSAGAPTWWASFPNDAALLRLAGMLLIEQNDEWLVARRYLSQESLALVLEDKPTQEVAQLTSA